MAAQENAANIKAEAIEIHVEAPANGTVQAARPLWCRRRRGNPNLYWLTVTEEHAEQKLIIEPRRLTPGVARGHRGPAGINEEHISMEELSDSGAGRRRQQIAVGASERLSRLRGRDADDGSKNHRRKKVHPFHAGQLVLSG
jgi:hypothetical protein